MPIPARSRLLITLWLMAWLTMCDESGKPSGNEYQLEPGDDAHTVAGRLAREKAAPTNINRRVHYPNSGWK